MAEKEYIINDNVVIPDHIKKMSRDELEREIARLEKEHLESKREIETSRRNERRSS